MLLKDKIVLRMKNFNILRVHWKIRPLGGVTKNQYGGGGDCLKRWAWTVFQFKGGGSLARKRGWCFWGGSWYPNAHYAWYTFNYSVHWGINPHSKTQHPSLSCQAFLPSHKSGNCLSPLLFRQSPPIYWFFVKLPL